MIGAPLDRHQLDPFDYSETVLVAGQIVTIPSAILPGDLSRAVVVVQYAGGPFRFTLHGISPSPTFGGPAEDGDAEDLNGYEARKWRACLAQGATSGTTRAWIYLRRL